MFKLIKEKISGWFKGKEEPKKIDEEKLKVKKSSNVENKKKPEKKSKSKKNELAEEWENVKKEIEKKEKEKLVGDEANKEIIGENSVGEEGEEKVFDENETDFQKLARQPARVETSGFARDVNKLDANLDIVEQEVGEKEIPAEPEKEGNFFSKLMKRMASSRLDESSFNELFIEFELVLLENNVALEVVDKIKEILARELIGKQFKKSESGQKILDALKESVSEILIEAPDLTELIKNKEGVFVILFFGINGSGKTTSIAKLAYKFEKAGMSCVLAAADTFRAASIEQLEEHANKLNVPIVKKDYQADPAAVGFEAIQFAKKNRKKVVLIDTAGRMYTKANLMKEMEKIVRVTNPDLKLFVGESITGNDATEQAKTFNETVGIDGAILSKADVDEKAGAILSVSFVTQKPIYYLGVGQNYEDLKEFRKKDLLKGLGLE